jgi:membrane-anchored protein YejM (alkaline phosphatase superfamily)
MLRVVSPARWLTSILSRATFLPFGVKILGLLLLFLRIGQLSLVRRLGVGSATASRVVTISMVCSRVGYAVLMLGLARLQWGMFARSCRMVLVPRLGICSPMSTVALLTLLYARWQLMYADPGTPP